MRDANVAIVDGGGANIASLRNAFLRIGVDAELTAEQDKIAAASHVILPGVGAAAPAMQRLEESGLADTLRKLQKPVLGICLGMQLLGEHSEENDVPCLGVFPGTSARLAGGPGLTVPNMGWCRVEQTVASPLFEGIPNGSWFYFVHSYALPVNECTVGVTTHGNSFSSVFRKESFHAVQFHPERSSSAGSRLLQNFLALSA